MTARRVDGTGGLRESKKRETRESIETAALELFEAQGYDGTTLAEIAAAARVAPRTIFSYFATKEDLVFAEQPVFQQRLERALADRPAGTTTVDALRRFLTSADNADAQARRRRRIIAASGRLRAGERARFEPIQGILATAIARDLGADPDDVRPVFVAASMTVAFSAARNRLLAGSDLPLSHADSLRVLDLALTFLEGGLGALREEEPPNGAEEPSSR